MLGNRSNVLGDHLGTDRGPAAGRDASLLLLWPHQCVFLSGCVSEIMKCIGYIYSNYEVKPIGDQKAAYMARIGEISPGTFLLYYKGNDVLTMMGLVLINGALVFYFCYIGFIIFMKVAGLILFQAKIVVLLRGNQTVPHANQQITERIPDLLLVGVFGAFPGDQHRRDDVREQCVPASRPDDDICRPFALK
jgi:hypothetical protein